MAKGNPPLTFERLLAAIDRLKLSIKERQALLFRYGLVDGRVHTVPEVSKRSRLTRAAVRSVETQLLAALREIA